MHILRGLHFSEPDTKERFDQSIVSCFWSQRPGNCPAKPGPEGALFLDMQTRVQRKNTCRNTKPDFRRTTSATRVPVMITVALGFASFLWMPMFFRFPLGIQRPFVGLFSLFWDEWKEVSVTKDRKWGPRPENGGRRQVRKTSLSKDDLPIPGRDREGEWYVSWRHGKTKRY